MFLGLGFLGGGFVPLANTPILPENMTPTCKALDGSARLLFPCPSPLNPPHKAFFQRDDIANNYNLEIRKMLTGVSIRYNHLRQPTTSNFSILWRLSTFNNC